MANLKDLYRNEVAPKLREKLGLDNPMLVPRITKIVINMGFGIVEKDVQKKLVDELAAITGQHPMLCKARKSVSNFKLREGMIVGAKVTLRGDRMYEFLERLSRITLPRIRDFRGIPARGFDGRGNYTLGIKEEQIFPEIGNNHATAEQGFDMTVVTTATDNARARALLEGIGFPFVGRNNAR